MMIKTAALGFVLALASASAATAMCGSAQMTMAKAPIVEKTVTVASVPTDMWLLPYLS